MNQDSDHCDDINIVHTDNEKEFLMIFPSPDWEGPDIEILDKSQELDLNYSSLSVSHFVVGSGSTQACSNLESTRVESSGEDENEHEESVLSSEINWEIHCKQRIISPVWNYGRKLPGGEKAEFNYCKKIIPAKQSNTSNMISHIMHTHKEPAKELSKELEKQKDAKKISNNKRDAERKVKRSILNISTRKGILSSFKNAKMDELLVEFIAIENIKL